MRCVSTVEVISAAPYRKIGGGPATRLLQILHDLKWVVVQEIQEVTVVFRSSDVSSGSFFDRTRQ